MKGRIGSQFRRENPRILTLFKKRAIIIPLWQRSLRHSGGGVAFRNNNAFRTKGLEMNEMRDVSRFLNMNKNP